MQPTHDHLIGVLLCITSTAFFAASTFVLLDDAPSIGSIFNRNCSDGKYECRITPSYAGGYALTTLLPLSSIPFLIFLMVRYVTLRLFLRNWFGLWILVLPFQKIKSSWASEISRESHSKSSMLSDAILLIKNKSTAIRTESDLDLIRTTFDEDLSKADTVWASLSYKQKNTHSVNTLS